MSTNSFSNAIFATPQYSEMKVNVMDEEGKIQPFVNVTQLKYSSSEITLTFVDESTKKIKLYKGYKVNGIDPEDYGIRLSESGGCYLTTACVTSNDLPDNCYELETLRKYRDEYLLSSSNGQRDVQHYYEISPKIVEEIDSLNNNKEIYSNLYQELVLPCVELIEQAENEHVYELYKSKTLELERKYLS